uniref:Uncharacterized protein n=1 Tax=Leersia perrieri TaxID=77586 RepID=A0A0D9XZS4_9ORYZ
MASQSNLPRSSKFTNSPHEQVSTLPMEPAAFAATSVLQYSGASFSDNLEEESEMENVGPNKARGIKVKEKAICGSRRPIGGFEQATQRNKKKRSDSNTVQAEAVKQSQPYTMMQGHPEIPINYNYMHMPGNYHVEGASLLQSSGYFTTSEQGQGMQNGEATQTFDTYPYTMFGHFS